MTDNTVLDRIARLRALMPTVDQIEDDALREDVLGLWLDVWSKSEWEDVEDCPSNPKLPGLPIIRQANCVAQMAVAAASLIEASYDELTFDRDRLLAGGLLLDLSKLVEQAPTGQPGHSRFTAITGVMNHAVFGAHMALERGLEHGIINIILSHTRLNNTAPMTPEAVILHYLDYMLADCMRQKRGNGLLMRGDLNYGV